jgi:glycogen operon protein
MIRSVFHHTHEYGGFRLRYGHALPFGVSHVPGGLNFSIFSSHATGCTLVLFRKGEAQPYAEIPYPPECKVGDVFAMIVYDLDFEELEYGFRMEGPWQPKVGHYFDARNILLDPYAREISGREAWLCAAPPQPIYPHRARIPFEDFEWGHDRPIDLPVEDLVIYEMHVRGFTRHPSSGVRHPGTYEGMIEKIPYLQSLGVNCVELMPIFEFDECENTRINPETGELLCNYWGYSTLGFYAPKSGYAATGVHGTQVSEFKNLIKALHTAGISVILDVVFNHTAEGDERGPTISFRGIDNQTYYMLNPDGSYANYTGCGNTLNCNHPVVRNFVIDCLRYWVSEFHLDGFRFDLASVLGRDPNGHPLANPPLLESLAHDPILAGCDLIAEAWDAGGLYQVGNFPSYGRWMEWNGHYRDAARRFLRGDAGVAGEMVQGILGSPNLYAPSGRKPTASVNFITCHDGFPLRDLYSYNDKHNLANGEQNRDGANDNYCWNCGVEGETDDPEINRLRYRLQRNALALLFLSQGVPMLSMGDELWRTQGGNNNAYCHDAEWNWLDWSGFDASALEEIAPHATGHKELGAATGLHRFVSLLANFRRYHNKLRQPEFFTGTDTQHCGYADISWHGIKPYEPDWGPLSHSLAFMIAGDISLASGPKADFIYAAFNMWHEPLSFGLPKLPEGMRWFRVIDTGRNSPDDFLLPGLEQLLADQTSILIQDRSVVLLVGNRAGRLG